MLAAYQHVPPLQPFSVGNAASNKCVQQVYVLHLYQAAQLTNISVTT